MEFFLKRPSVRAAQYDGSTESINNVLRLVDGSAGVPKYTISNDRGAPNLTVELEAGGPLHMMRDDWYVLERVEHGTTTRVMEDRDFRRMYESRNEPVTVSSKPTDAEAERKAAADMQALQVRGTALEAALRINPGQAYAPDVIKGAELFRDYLIGSNEGKAVVTDSMLAAMWPTPAKK